MRNFEFLEPKSPREASRMLAASGEESRLFAGGVALMLAMRQRMVTPSHLVYLGGVPGMDRIEFDEREGLRIGALARHQDIADSPVVKKLYPVLAGMAAHLANPQVRNQGTIGGNLCFADPASDPPSCLLALGAEVRTVGPGGERSIPMEEFLIDYYTTALEPAEVVTEIRLPAMPPDAKGAYVRFLRTAAEHRPLVNVAVVARQGAARIAIGAAVPIPVRAKRAEQFLQGKSIKPDVLEEAAAIAAADVTPLSDFRGSEQYRREMIRVVTRRTLAAALC